MDPRTVMNMMHSMLKGAGLPKNLRAEDGSVLTGIETYSDSESPEESGESSQGILNSIGGLLSRFSGAVVKHYWVCLKYGSRGDALWSLS